MFVKNVDTDEKIANIITLLATYSRGDIIPHAEIAQVSGLTSGTPKYYSLVRRARDLYRTSSGVWSREVNSVGYRLLTTDQSLTEEQHDRRRRMRRQGTIGSECARTIPDNALTDHQRRLRAHILESYDKARKDILENERHEQWLLRPAADRPMKIVPPRPRDRDVV